MTTETKHGRSAESIVEGGAGGLYHRAIVLYELESALYTAGEEFRFEETEPATGLVHLIDALYKRVQALSLTDDAELTMDRACGACGGAGTWDGKGTPCDECNGTGIEVAHDS